MKHSAEEKVIRSIRIRRSLYELAIEEASGARPYTISVNDLIERGVALAVEELKHRREVKREGE